MPPIHRPTQRGTRSFTSQALLLGGALGWLAILHPAHAAHVAANELAAVPVVTTAVVQEDIASRLSGIGTVQSAQTVTVKVRVDGQLERVAFTEGQDVRQGELLAQIDPRPLQASLNQAVAQKARDEASLSAALKDFARYTTLLNQGQIPRQTVDAQQATVDQARASVQADQAQIDNARVQLGFTSIRAPLNGRTGMRLVDAGNIVHAADPTGLVVINQIDPIAVLFTLPESAFQTVNQAMQGGGGKALTVTALARDGSATLGTGRLLLLNNQIDTATGTFQLKALFPNAAHKLWPGQYVNVNLDIGIRRGALTLPVAAVQRGANGLYVYVVKSDHTVAAQGIRTAESQDGKAIIDAGLSAGQRVVLEGQFKIRPGLTVSEVAKAPARP